MIEKGRVSKPGRIVELDVSPSTNPSPSAARRNTLARDAAPDRLLNTEEAAAVLGLKASTLRTWRCTKAVDIQFVKIGAAARYRKADLLRYIDEHTEGGAV